MIYSPGMRDFLVSGFGRISHRRTDGRRDNTKMLNELEEQGPLGDGVFHPRRWGREGKGSEEKVEETQPTVREEQEVDGWVWRGMRGALCEEIRSVSVCVMVTDKEKRREL